MKRYAARQFRYAARHLSYASGRSKAFASHATRVLSRSRSFLAHSEQSAELGAPADRSDLGMQPVFYPRGYFPPVSSTERQREFRERNPGYYQRLHAKRRAELKGRVELALRAAERAAAAQVTLTLPVPTWRLALPAPVVDPLLVELNALVAQRATVTIARSQAA
jgi:hypothetical protein